MIIMIIGVVIIFLTVLIALGLLVVAFPILYNFIGNNILNILFIKKNIGDNKFKDFGYAMIDYGEKELIIMKDYIIYAVNTVLIFLLITTAIISAWQLVKSKNKNFSKKIFISNFFMITITIILLSLAVVVTGQWWLIVVMGLLAIGQGLLQLAYFVTLKESSDKKTKIKLNEVEKKITVTNKKISDIEEKIIESENKIDTVKDKVDELELNALLFENEVQSDEQFIEKIEENEQITNNNIDTEEENSQLDFDFIANAVLDNETNEIDENLENSSKMLPENNLQEVEETKELKDFEANDHKLENVELTAFENNINIETEPLLEQAELARTLSELKDTTEFAQENDESNSLITAETLTSTIISDKNSTNDKLNLSGNQTPVEFNESTLENDTSELFDTSEITEENLNFSDIKIEPNVELNSINEQSQLNSTLDIDQSSVINNDNSDSVELSDSTLDDYIKDDSAFTDEFDLLTSAEKDQDYKDSIKPSQLQGIKDLNKYNQSEQINNNLSWLMDEINANITTNDEELTENYNPGTTTSLIEEINQHQLSKKSKNLEFDDSWDQFLKENQIIGGEETMNDQKNRNDDLSFNNSHNEDNLISDEKDNEINLRKVYYHSPVSGKTIEIDKDKTQEVLFSDNDLYEENYFESKPNDLNDYYTSYAESSNSLHNTNFEETKPNESPFAEATVTENFNTQEINDDLYNWSNNSLNKNNHHNQDVYGRAGAETVHNDPIQSLTNELLGSEVNYFDNEKMSQHQHINVEPDLVNKSHLSISTCPICQMNSRKK